MKRTRTTLLLSLAAASLAAACGGGSSQQQPEDDTGSVDTMISSDTGECLALTVTPTIDDPGTLPADTTTTELTLRFDTAVTGVEARTNVLIGGAGAVIDEVVDIDGRTWAVRVSGLAVNGSYTLSVTEDGSPGIHEPQCNAGLSGPAELTFYVQGWSLREPFASAGPVPAISGPAFVDVTEERGIAGVTSGYERALVADVDADHLEDLVLWPIAAPNIPKVLKRVGNDASTFFTDFTGASGLNAANASIFVFGDLDNDGDNDLVSGINAGSASGTLGVWRNDGNGVFAHEGSAGIADPSIPVGNDTFIKEMAAMTLADLDQDGFLDLYLGTWYSASPDVEGQLWPPADELYRGNGDGTFSPATLPDQHNPLTDVSAPALADISRAAYGISPGDYDGDGDIDLFVNNYGAGRPAAGSTPKYIDHNFLWRNDGGMTFVDVGVEAQVAATTRGIGGVEDEQPLVMEGITYPSPIGGNGFGSQWADFDNDGDLDLIVGTIAHPDYTQSDRTMLHVNQGTLPFTEESAARGLEYYEDELHPAMVDVDNDGRLDLAMSRLRGGSQWELYFQQEDATFLRVSKTVSGVEISRPGPTVWFDVDGDGDLDFFMPLSGGGVLMRNDLGQNNNWLSLELIGDAPRDATGARVTLTSTTGTQVREITSGNGHYNTQSTRRAHFGLGQDNGAQGVQIRWPDGTIQELGDLRANIRLRVTKGGAIELH